MAITREEFFNKKANASLWDVAVSIKRGNPLPLDADSIFESYSALETYAADVLAYPGQIVAVVNEDSTGIYYLDQNLAIQPVGMIPSGDSKTIEVTANGMISLLGAAGAENGTIPMIEEGALTWKTLEDIGAGDGNDNTTYEFDFANEKITITPKHNGVAQDAVELDLSAFITADELAEELGKLTDTTYSVAEGEKVLKLSETVFSTEIGLKHENGMISLTGINGEVIAEFSDADFIKDSVLDDVEYNAETQEITFTWKTVNGETKTDSISVADFVQTYEAGNGLELTSNSFAVKVDGESENFLTVGTNGVKLAGIQSAIDAAKDAAIQDAVGKYATTSALTELETALDGRLDTLEAIDHTLLATKAELEPVATAASNAETAVGNLEQRFDEIVAVGGEPNAINKIQVNGSELTITNKTVNIEVPTTLFGLEGWTALDERVTAAKTQADKGVDEAGKANAAAASNAEEIGKHETRIGNLEDTKTNHETRILSLESADSTHAAEYTTLKERVDAHNEAIAKKADQTVVDGISAKASTNETAIKTLNETTIPGVLTEVGKKADATNVYTKAEINAITGVLTEGKTLVDMISEAQEAAEYDDTEVRGLIEDNANAIAAIYTAGSEGAPATGVLASEITRVEGLITAEANRADGIEKGLDSRLQTVEAFWKEAVRDETEKNVIDTLKEIQDYIAADESGASAMAAKINEHTDRLDEIFVAANGETPASGMLVTEIARVEAKITTNEQAIAAINHSETGILATAKKYTDDQIAAIPIAGALLGLVKSSEEDNKIKVETDGTMSLNRVSTDKLYIPENSSLVLNGGSASD